MRTTLLASACAAACVAAVPAVAGADNIVYLAGPAADAAHDAGMRHALRQMPANVTANPRWPADRRIGKVSVLKSNLRNKRAGAIVRVVRRELRRAGNGGRVAVDEINPNHWSAAQAQELRTAWVKLGDDAKRVSMYASPAMVEQVGRTDPRRPLAVKQRRLFDVLKRSGSTYLQTYRGGWAPLDEAAMAGHLTRWVARWPERTLDRLRLLVGPSHGIGQAALWNRIRATPAGRTLLGNGVGLVGGRAMTPSEAVGWVAQYRAFTAAPDASPPGGDVTPPRVGAPDITIGRRVPRAAPFSVTSNREGRAVVRLLPLTGARKGDARVIGTLGFGAAGSRAGRLPADVRPGRYRLVVTFWGHGTKERTAVDITITGR